MKSGSNLDEGCCEPNDPLFNSALDAKAMMRRHLVGLKVRVAAMSRRLKSAVGSDASKSILSFIKEEGDRCCDSLSFLHADVLESSDSSEDLEEGVCELEDKLFDIREECLRALSRKAISLEPLISPVVTNKMPTDSSSSREETKSPIMLKRYARCPVQSNAKKDVSVDRYIDKITRFSAPNQIKDDFMENCKPPLERLSQENVNKNFSVVASNNASKQGNVRFLSKPHCKEPFANIEVKGEVKRSASPLNPSAPAFYYNSDFLNPIRNIHGNAGGVFDQASILTPGPKLTLECFDGDILKYFGCKQRFKRHVEGVYNNFKDRLAFLDSLCTGQAYEVISGLSCLFDSKYAYLKAWERLDSRFGDTRKLMNQLRQRLVLGPQIKDGDGKGLLSLADSMFIVKLVFRAGISFRC